MNNQQYFSGLRQSLGVLCDALAYNYKEDALSRYLQFYDGDGYAKVYAQLLDADYPEDQVKEIMLAAQYITILVYADYHINIMTQGLTLTNWATKEVTPVIDLPVAVVPWIVGMVYRRVL
jgi:hypothetical protein